MFTFAFILNIVVLGIGGLLLLVGLLLLGFGVFALLKAQRAPEAAPSYSASVDYPAENGIEKDFEDKQQWADAIAGESGGSGGGGGSAGDGSGGGGSGDGGGVASGPEGSANSSQAPGGNTSSNWFKNVKHAREKTFLVVGGLLALIGVYMLLSTIALIA